MKYSRRMMMRVAIGLTISATTRRWLAKAGRTLAEQRTTRETGLTDLAIDIQLDVCIVGPKYRVDRKYEVLNDKPEAEEDDAQIPAFADKA